MKGQWKKARVSKVKKAEKVVATKVGVPTEKAIVSLMKKVADKEIAKTLELKYVAVSSGYTNVTFNSAISSFGEAYPALPQCIPGAATSWSRLGNSITPTKCQLKINLALTSVNRTIAIKAHIFVLSLKKFSNLTNTLSSGGAPLLFNNGAGSTVVYDGYPATALYKKNFEQFTFHHHKSHVFLQNAGLPNGDTTSGSSPNVTVPAAQVTYTFNIPLPNKLFYDELGSVSYPNNAAPFFMIGYEKLDGTAPDSTNQNISVSWVNDMWFYDA